MFIYIFWLFGFVVERYYTQSSKDFLCSQHGHTIIFFFIYIFWLFGFVIERYYTQSSKDFCVAYMGTQLFSFLFISFGSLVLL